MITRKFRLIDMSDGQIEQWSSPSLVCPSQDDHEYWCTWWHTPMYWNTEICEFRGYLDLSPFQDGKIYAPAFPHQLRPLVPENLLQLKACLRALENAAEKGCRISTNSMNELKVFVNHCETEGFLAYP